MNKTMSREEILKVWKNKKNKYSSQKTIVDNFNFDSKREAKRYVELKILERAGEIENLHLQFRLDIVVNNFNIGFYKADFAYVDTKTKQQIFEDCKGYKTPIYRIKKKLIKAIYNIEILET